MKRLLFILPILAIFALTETASAQYYGSPQTRVRFAGGFGHAGFFYRPLLSYGEWIELDPGFYAWRPHRTPYGWRPYSRGHWVWSDYGWYWVSNEPFGWAVYHYGRWFYDEYYGWIWIPDDIWGPSWVEWRYDDNYIGWAPLPPYAGFRMNVGIHFTITWNAPYTYWCFVRHKHFTKTNYSHYVVSSTTTRRLIRTTRTTRDYSIDRGTLFNRGVDRSYIEQRGRVRVEPYEVTRSNSRQETVVRSSGVRRIESYRPDVDQGRGEPERIEARKATRSTGLQIDRVDRSRQTDTDTRRPNERSTAPSRMEQQPPATRTNPEGRSEPRTRTREEQKPPKKDQSERFVPAPERSQTASRSGARVATPQVKPRESTGSRQAVRPPSTSTERNAPASPSSDRKKKR